MSQQKIKNKRIPQTPPHTHNAGFDSPYLLQLLKHNSNECTEEKLPGIQKETAEKENKWTKFFLRRFFLTFFLISLKF